MKDTMGCAEDGAILRGSDKTPAPRTSGRAQNRDGFPIVPPMDAEVFLVHRDHRVVGEQSTHADQASVSNGPRIGANPLREERSGAPLILPAWRRKGWFPASDLARSSWGRIIRLTGKPVRWRLSWSHSASSAVRRIVIV